MQDVALLREELWTVDRCGQGVCPCDCCERADDEDFDDLPANTINPEGAREV